MVFNISPVSLHCEYILCGFESGVSGFQLGQTKRKIMMIDSRVFAIFRALPQDISVFECIPFGFESGVSGFQLGQKKRKIMMIYSRVFAIFRALSQDISVFQY